ncbi:uncharacterized protein [Diabrotica undecimpunctata]|uniref:uncharacterized protein n=1 Tax=Diabrotica undecimpunctata TaxID=50387 RepID=UPI003B63FFA0
MEYAVLSVSLGYHITKQQIRQKPSVQDVIERITTLKWNWTGGQDAWKPRNYTRSRGLPPTRRSDDVKRLAGNWLQAAQCREHWKELRESKRIYVLYYYLCQKHDAFFLLGPV